MTQKLYHLLNSLPSLASEIFLMLAFAIIIIIDLIVFQKKDNIEGQSEGNKWLWGFSLAIVLFAGFLTFSNQVSLQGIGNLKYYFIIDRPAIFFKIIIIIAAIICLFHVKIFNYILPNEFYPLLIFQIFGLFLLSIASNFILIYIAIEIISIASYLLVSFSLNKNSSEAAVKYALFGGISSAVMLYGISLIYGITGTLDLLNPDFSRYLEGIDSAPLSLIFLLTLGGFLFKISAFPFHLWVPDVFEATTTPIISFLSIAPKAAGILVFTRIITVMPISQQNLIIIISMASIAFGNFSALRQTNVKRMLGYSTIAQSGFIIGAIACLSNLGLQSAFFNFFGYIFSNMLAFLVIDVFGDKANPSTTYTLENYQGLGLKYPMWGILLIISMISLAGLPPTVGFSGKLFIFSALWENYQLTKNSLVLTLFVFGLINTAISLYFYLKIPFRAFFKPSNENIVYSLQKNQLFISIVVAFPVLFLFFRSELLINWLVQILK